MQIIFMRHGEAGHNQGARLRGDAAYKDPAYADAHLTATGRQQALETAKILEARFGRFDHVFTSPLTRCLQTTQIVHSIVPSRSPIATDFLLERSGDGHVCNDRKPRETLVKRYPEWGFAIPEESLLNSGMPREEPEAVKKRMEFIVNLALKMGGESALIVSSCDSIYEYTKEYLPHAGYVVKSFS